MSHHLPSQARGDAFWHRGMSNFFKQDLDELELKKKKGNERKLCAKK